MSQLSSLHLRKINFPAYFKKAVLSATAFFIFMFYVCADAGVGKNKTESYKDIIEKAQNLSLQKDRQQATVILVQALKRETPTSKAYSELKKALNDNVGVFYSEKTQQLYELAISIRKIDLIQAQAKITEALRLEPDNQTVLLENVRIVLAKGDCTTATELLQKMRLFNPFEEAILLAQAQAAICSNDIAKYFAVRSQVEQKKWQYARDWQGLDLERLIREKNLSKAKEAFQQLQKMDPLNPELAYWEWKIDIDGGRKNDLAAEKYLNTCKNIAAGQYRKYLSDALLCRRTKEIESFLKKANGSI